MRRVRVFLYSFALVFEGTWKSSKTTCHFYLLIFSLKIYFYIVPSLNEVQLTLADTVKSLEVILDHVGAAIKKMHTSIFI